MDNWFTIKKLNKQLWGIAEFGHFEKVISYLLVGERKAVLIDTGMGIISINEAIRKITKLPVTVINTHSHFDHVGSNHEFAEVLFFDCSFSRNIADKGWENVDIRKYLEPETFYTNPEKFNLEKFKIKPYRQAKVLPKKGNLKIDIFNFEIISTPGHSPDSICIYEKTLKYLFCGDTLYDGPIYINLPESNLEDYQKSIRRLLEINTKVKFFGGHNQFQFNPELINNINNKLTTAYSGRIPVVGNLYILL